MQQIETYIKETIGLSVNVESVSKETLADLPLYIRETYEIYSARIFNRDLLIIAFREEGEFSIFQIEKHLDLIRNMLKSLVILTAKTMTAINRRRLIEKRINFIVPGKQLFIPEMLLDLRESFSEVGKRENKGRLLPSAQYILLYYILHRTDGLFSNQSFKELAEVLGYTQTAVANAAEELRSLNLCKIEGVKEKHIRFERDHPKLWNMAKPHLINPVLKWIYVDKKPPAWMLHSNLSALPTYSDINPGKLAYYAIDRTSYYTFQKNGILINENKYEGAYCLEVWKYDSIKLAEGIAPAGVVDPLSLYLSLKDSRDERIEMALDQIIHNYIW